MLAILTCYFNPSTIYNDKKDNHYRLKNYEFFREQVKKEGVDLFVIELSFGDDSFKIVPDGENIKQIRTSDIMFQKERLLNILLDELPEKYTNVCWMDCDIVYVANNWSQRIENSLINNKITQPYTWCTGAANCDLYRVGKYQFNFENSKGNGNYRSSYSSDYSHKSWFNAHSGHVGYVWAAKRDFIEKHRFYDPIITGAGDLFIVMACMGHFNFLDQNPNLNKLSQKVVNHYLDWAIPVYEDVNKKIGCTSDLILHLWHGDIKNRDYLYQSKCLQESNFDPNEDLFIGDDLCWHWKRDNKTLQESIINIFKSQQPS